MTCHTSQGIAVLVGVTYLCCLGSALLISRGLAAQTRDPSHSVPALIDTLKDADPEAHSYAAEALGRIGPAAVPALTEALKDADPQVRRRAAEVLGRIGPAAHTAVPALIDALKDADPGSA